MRVEKKMETNTSCHNQSQGSNVFIVYNLTRPHIKENFMCNKILIDYFWKSLSIIKEINLFFLLQIACKEIYLDYGLVFSFLEIIVNVTVWIVDASLVRVMFLSPFVSRYHSLHYNANITFS